MGQKEKRRMVGELARAIVFGMIGDVIVIMLLCFACAGLMAKEVLPQERIQIISPLICAIGILIGCRIAIGKCGYGALPVSLGCGAASLLLWYFVRLIFHFESVFGWQNMGIGMGAAVAAALLWSGRKRKRR